MDYFRKIIYLNAYEEGGLGESAGFVKLSKKKTRWKAEIHLTGDAGLQGEKVYLLDKDKNAVNKMLYGTITEPGNEIVMECSSGDMGMLKGELAGILIGGEGHVICAGLEDDSIQISDYIGSRHTVREEKRQEPESAAAAAEEPKNAEEPKSVEIRAAEMPAEKKAADEETPGEKTEPSPEAVVPEEEEEEEEIIQVELADEHDEINVFRKLLDTRTDMYPFEDDEIEECVQIAPPDFSDFPKEYWQMGSNTFLLQGYYNYRHLILARKGEKMYVGIPGQFHRRDKYLADMFGFSRFKGIQKRQERLGDFGYWMKEIELSPVSGGMICVPECDGESPLEADGMQSF